MTAMVITLTPEELAVAASVAVRRRVESVAKGYGSTYGLKSTQVPLWEQDIQACCGELAAAKALGLYWSGVNERNASDVGDGYQVRTASRPTDRLIVHAEDADDAVFVLVLGRAPVFEVVGWIAGVDAKRDHYWTDPGTGRPAFFVPREDLDAIEPLRGKGARTTGDGLALDDEIRY